MLARRAGMTENAFRAKEAEAFFLTTQLNTAKADVVEQSKVAERAVREAKEAINGYASQIELVDELKAANVKLKADQETWSTSITESQKARDEALLQVIEAERVTAAAQEEAAKARRELETLKANQQRMIEEAVKEYALGAEAAFSAGVDVAESLMSFVSTFGDELPQLPEKLEEFKAKFELNPAWFEEAENRE